MSKIKIIRENSGSGGGMVYVLGFIGALVYYWQLADTFGQFVLAFLKAIVWPAFLVYQAFERLAT